MVGDVRARVRSEFPPEQWEEAERALARCGTGEPERLQHAVLNLARGDLGELKAMANHTEIDYRDVLWWGESARQRRWITLRRWLRRPVRPV